VGLAVAVRHRLLAPSDMQTLLAFISSPKPGNLTDGEREERFNVILNLDFGVSPRIETNLD
jgi:hypothetical protein